MVKPAPFTLIVQRTKRKKKMCIPCLECENNNGWISFQLVDELGNGSSYANLKYLLTDSSGTIYEGQLDSNGMAKHEHIACGAIILSFEEKYSGTDDWYNNLIKRENYRLPITQLQYAAEQTEWKEWTNIHQTYSNDSIKHNQLEVRDFVEHVMHLPVYEIYLKTSAPKQEWEMAEKARGLMPTEKRAQVPSYGIGLEVNKNHILEIKALRSLRPKLSLSKDFSALNLYQLAFFAAMSYKNLICATRKKDDENNSLFTTYYKANGLTTYAGIGHTLVDEWANHKESGFYGNATGPNQEYYLLLEDVPYSKRFEIVPFDPDLYPQNKWDRRISTPNEPLAWYVENRQETPDSVHFFDDSMLGYLLGKGTHTQGFLTHNDKAVIISIRGTQEFDDYLTDLQAQQVAIEGYSYKAHAHKGFHDAYNAIRPFIKSYLDRFHTNQKIIVMGHSLGGAIATLVAEWIRQQAKYTNNDNSKVILYTYGSPRVGDVKFSEQANLTHYRMVSENDPIPSLPGTWLTNRKQALILGGLGAYLATRVLDNDSNSLYSHQGKLRHFTNLNLHNPRLVSDEIMWEPGCQGMQICAKALELNAQLPNRVEFGKQLLSISDHSIFNSYIPFIHATLLRWKTSLDTGNPVLSEHELASLKASLMSYREKLDELLKAGFVFIPITNERNMFQRIITANQLEAEIEQLNKDIERANTLTQTVITKQAFFGTDLTSDENIETIYNKWREKDLTCKRSQYIASIQN